MTYLHDIKDAAPSYRPRVVVPFPVEAPSADDRGAAAEYLLRRGLDPELARFNGWYASRDADPEGSLRIVIPATNSGNFPFWQARAVESGVEPRYQSPPGVPREDSVVIVWPALGRHAPGVVVVVEGPMDALAAAMVGVVGVSLMGATPPLAAFDTIARRFPGALHLVIPDDDLRAAGAAAVRRLAERGRIAQLRLLPAGAKDLAELSRAQREELILRGGAP